MIKFKINHFKFEVKLTIIALYYQILSNLWIEAFTYYLLKSIPGIFDKTESSICKNSWVSRIPYLLIYTYKKQSNF